MRFAVRSQAFVCFDRHHGATKNLHSRAAVDFINDEQGRLAFLARVLRGAEKCPLNYGELTGFSFAYGGSKPGDEIPIFRILVKNRSEDLRFFRILDGHIIIVAQHRLPL